MDWAYLLTSIDGRISRQPFWTAVLIFLVVEVAAYGVLGERWSSIVSLLLAYPEFAVLAKRGHDRNVSTWVPGAFIAGAVVLDLLVLVDLSGPAERPTMLFLVIGIPVLLLFVVLLVDFGLRRGSIGSNRYGPDPLETWSRTRTG